MNANSFLQQLIDLPAPVKDQEEKEIERFRTDPALTGCCLLNAAAFREFLLQRRFLSLAYTPLLDLAIDLLRSQDAKAVLRQLIQEEYPADGQSHREDLAADLALIGVSPIDLASAKPSKAAETAIRRIYSLLHAYGLSADSSTSRGDAAILTVVRMWGEVLVAEEFEAFCPSLSRLGLTPTNSRFYWPHIVHDRKAGGHTNRNGRLTHSDLLEQEIKKLSDSPEAILKAVNEVISIKLNYYRQVSAI